MKLDKQIQNNHYGTVLGQTFDVHIGTAAWEAHSAVWNLANNSIFALRAKKTTENDARFGWAQNLSHAYGLLARSQAFWNVSVIQMIFTILCLLNSDNIVSLLKSFGNFNPN
jgi:hypothetical protein